MRVSYKGANGELMVRADLYVAEYSPSQDAFHHQSLAESVRDGIHHVKWGEKAKGYDWIVFYVGTSQGAYDAIDDMRKRQEEGE